MLACLDEPNLQLYQFQILAHQQFHVPSIVLRIGKVLSAAVKVRGRRGALLVTVTAPAGDQARYVAEFITAVVNMNNWGAQPGQWMVKLVW